MKTKSPSLSQPTTLALNQSLPSRAIPRLVKTISFVLLTLLLWAWQGQATGFFDGFESYVTGGTSDGALDKNLSGGPNAAPNGSGNPWFGPNPPNLHVVTAQNGVTPHTGSKMIRGKYNVWDNDQDWFNLVWRCSPTHTVYYGNIVFDWWFYDPAGNGSNRAYYDDYLALCQYANVPNNTDYAASMPAYVAGGQRMCLGAASNLGTGSDTTKYQARIVGATDGFNANGWFNVNRTRSIGWHHARIVVGDPNGANTMAYFYIDDMSTALLSHKITTTTGFNAIEINACMAPSGTIKSGYFDDFCFVDSASKPSISLQPTDQVVSLTSNATFSVTASGSPAVSYFWRKDTTPLSNDGRITGADTATLSIANVSWADVGTYSCVVSNIAGMVTSSGAVLSIPPGPVVLGQTVNGLDYLNGGAYAATVEDTVALAVTASAIHPYNYQWQKDGVDLTDGPTADGATISGSSGIAPAGSSACTLTITLANTNEAGLYSCVLSNWDGATNSATVALAVTVCPTINVQPRNVAVGTGTNATFTVANVAGAPPLGFQWYSARYGALATPTGKFSQIDDVRGSTLTVTSPTPDDNDSFWCVVTNSYDCPALSTTNTLTVYDPPIICGSPTNVSAFVSNTVSFHATSCGGTGPFSWTWKRGATVLNNGAHCSIVNGETNSDLTITGAIWADVGTYTCTVSNLAGTAVSAASTLSLRQAEFTWTDTFEELKPGRLGYNEGGPVTDPAIDWWWGFSPPNGQVVNAENYTLAGFSTRVAPYSGTNMVRAADSSLGDNERLNIPYRLNAGRAYSGNFMVDWYFYDPAGTGTPGTNFSDYLAVGYFGLPTTSDIPGSSPGGNVIWLGAYCGAGNTPAAGFDRTRYQVKISGAADGISGNTAFFNTSKTREVGWHHCRMAFGIPNGASTAVSFYIDDMVNPIMTHAIGSGFPNGFDVIDLNFHQHQTISDPNGYFDDISLQASNDPWIITQPASVAILPGQSATFSIVANCASYQWKKDGVIIDSATASSYTATDPGTYTCVVTGDKGSLESSNAVLSAVDMLAAGTGLRGQYYNGENFDTLVTTRLDSQVFFDGSSGGIPPGSGVPSTHFSIRWLGFIQPAISGNYSFYTRTDDGIRLWVNDQLIVDHWVGQAPAEWHGTVFLEAGQFYPIRMEYYQGTGGDFYSLSWASDYMPKALVPASALYAYPMITAQPASATNAAGSSASFTVAAIPTSTNATTFQWYRTGVGPLADQTATTLNLANVSESDAGSYYCVASNATWGETSATATLLLSQSITFADPAAHTYGDAPFALVGTASSGLTVTYTVTNGPATVSGDTLTITGAGSVTVRADQAGNSIYAPADSVFQTFTVNPATLTITAGDQAKVYGQTLDLGTTVFTTIPAQNGETVTAVTLTSPGAVPTAGVGSYPITPSAPTGTGGFNAANYNITYVNGTLTVTAATLIVTADGLLTYGSTNPIYTPHYAPLLNGDSPDVLYGSANFSTDATSTNYVGTNYIVHVEDLGTLSASNYVFAAGPDGVMTITNRSLTVTNVVASDKVYDTTTAAALDLSAAGLDALVNGDEASVTLITTNGVGTFANKNVGAGKPVSITGLFIVGDLGTNYLLLQPTATASITPADLAVSATGVDKVYDGTAEATVILSATPLPGDEVTSNYSSAAFESKNVGTGKTVNVSGITLGGADAGNYTFNISTTTTASITPRSLTVSAAGQDKVYDGHATATVVLSDNKLAGDDVTESYPSASFDNKNVGTGKPVSVTGITLGGADAGNYSLANATASATANITARSLTVTATGVDRVYDRTADATVLLSDNRLAGDDLSTIYTSATLADKDVGNAKPVSVSGIAIIGGADAGNYTLANTTAETTANITPAGLTVAGITAQSKAYDGNTTATLDTSAATLVGVLGRPGVEDVTLDTAGATGAFPDANVGDNKLVTISGLTISGADAVNYSLTQPTATANITAASSMTTLASSQNPSTNGALVTFTATVSSSAGTPTGNVVFRTNTAVLATVALDNEGRASVSTANLPEGTNTVEVEYAAQANWLGSSGTLMQVVNPAFVLSTTNALLSIVSNGDGTFTLNCLGTPGAEYYVAASPAVALPMSSWMALAGSTNTAAASGGLWSFTVSNAAPAFYRSVAIHPAP